MNTDTVRPMCFIAIPLAAKASQKKKKPAINFDKVYKCLEKAVSAEGFDCVRADFEAHGGFVHESMNERLLVAEYVIADVTLTNPMVAYQIGVRHGASARATLLIGAAEHLHSFPFDPHTFRVLSYSLNGKGSPDRNAAQSFQAALRERLTAARRGHWAVDYPIMQVTDGKPVETVKHSKTDVFMGHIESVGAIGQRIKCALAEDDAYQAVAKLDELQREIFSNRERVAQLHTALLGIYLGYREKKAYGHMEAIYGRLPGELRQTAVVKEQLALALNRLAEAEHDAGGYSRAASLRRRAERVLDEVSPESLSSETYSIRGRIYKGWFASALEAGDEQTARARLADAIRNYEQGVVADIRDTYPGINAVTLHLARGEPEDLERLKVIVPVVRFASEVAPQASEPEERYWQMATRLELACADRDWSGAERLGTELLALPAEDWMRETTVKNLGILRRAYRDDSRAVAALADLCKHLRPR